MAPQFPSPYANHYTDYVSQLILRCEVVHSYIFQYSRTSLIQTLVIWFASYPNQLVPLGKFVENSTKLTCLEIAGYQIKYSTVLWLLELQWSKGLNAGTCCK
jgi:hypothetical protein